jgi:flagellar protein FlaG
MEVNKMALSKIQSYKSIEDPFLSAITSIPVSKSVKNKDIENSAPLSEVKTKIPEEAKKAAEEKIQRVSELMNSYVRSIQRDIKIQVNNRTGDISVKVISEETGKVIREIPSQEMLELAARMEEMSGIFFDQNV